MKPFDSITASSQEILDSPVTWRILKNLTRYQLLPKNFEEPEIINTQLLSQRVSYASLKESAPQNHPVGLGKKHLHFTTQPGVNVKQCPGTNNMLCCHYHIINTISNCPYDCSYCYLQTYLNQSVLTIYVNEDDIFSQVKQLCTKAESMPTPLRVGTGELSDSLALDPITEFSSRLAQVMAEYSNVRLELKTKSKNVEHLFHLQKKDHVVISWSMNPAFIVNSEEHGTARFEERVMAAALSAQAGFNVGFHFDPMIYFPNWQLAYKEALTYLLSKVPHNKIQWISIGGLRYLPHLKSIAIKRHPNTNLFADETVSSNDGKIRYLRSQRTEMYSYLNQLIKQMAPNIYTYLCMESKPVWEKALGKLPDRGF